MDNNALVIVDREGTIRHWNTRAEQWFGYAAGTAVGQTLDLIVPPEFRADHWTGFRRAMDAGAAEMDGRSAPFPVRCATGVVTPFVGALTLLRDAGRRVIGAAVVFEPGA